MADPSRRRKRLQVVLEERDERSKHHCDEGRVVATMLSNHAFGAREHRPHPRHQENPAFSMSPSEGRPETGPTPYN